MKLSGNAEPVGFVITGDTFTIIIWVIVNIAILSIVASNLNVVRVQTDIACD